MNDACHHIVDLVDKFERFKPTGDCPYCEIERLRAIIAKDDTTESYKCPECGAWHLSTVISADAGSPNTGKPEL